MSRKHNESCGCQYQAPVMQYPVKETNCCCSFPTLVILILILLQFGARKHTSGFKQVDNGILFIIALFFLACCNPCKKY